MPVLCPPFESVRLAAFSFSDPYVQSELLSQLAHTQLSAGQFDAALHTLSSIPLPQERRSALLAADFSRLPAEKTEPLLKLLQGHPQTAFLAGAIAVFLLESKNLAAAWKLIETAETPFESEQQRYHFLEKVLPITKEHDEAKVLRLHQSFSGEPYKDWATLALVKHLTGKQRLDEAETFAGTLALPIRRSWTYLEMYRLITGPPAEKFLDKSIEEIETVHVNSDDDENAETLAVQLRILGQEAVKRGNRETGERLLERCESVTAELKIQMQRFRQQCFLGKVLWELRLISSIQDYVPVDEMLPLLSSGLDRARVLVWLAEAGRHEGWEQAIKELSIPERGVLESERGEEIARVLKRCIVEHQGESALGFSAEDSRLSGEALESLYFSPFNTADCGC